MTVSSPSWRLAAPVEAASPSDEMPFKPALASLLARVHAARILREHHVWEAVRILPDAAGLPEETKRSPALHGLMERDALAAALRLLAQSCQPAREFGSLDQHGDSWTATLIGGGAHPARRRRPVRAEHRDPAAAMLIALLASTDTGRSQLAARRRRTRAGRQKELSNE
jgi:hypothetical protein